MKNYRFIVALSAEDLENQVNGLLENGYSPVGAGAMVIASPPDENGQVAVRFTQTLLKKPA